jgi:hypothetical protein
MKTSKIISITLGLLLTTESLELSSNLPSDPITFNGTSGGSKKSNCGAIATSPNHVLNITDQINYMRIAVKTEAGNPTLLIDGPGGRFCILANKTSEIVAQMSGVWLPGKYSIYIGDRQGGKNAYTLYFTQQTKPNF